LYDLTHSTLDVGLLSLCSLVPLLVVPIVGGAIADAVDRRRLLLRTETGLAVVSLLLAGNALLPHPQVWALYAGEALATAIFSLGTPSMRSLLPRLVADWVTHVRRQGLGVCVAAALWGLALVGFGYAGALWLALGMLALAGAADFVSAVLRSTILLTATPDALRGRLSGIEFAQVASTPSLGNLEAGVVASLTSLRFSVVSGGLACIAGTVVCALALPRFIRYDSRHPDA
jgi:MFS-type transporter involved in bile tolerance (Atg22 family)